MWPPGSIAWSQSEAAEQRLKAVKAGLLTVLAELQPSIINCLDVQMRLDQRVAALRVVEAIRLHAASHDGKLPEELNQVTEVPVPDDPATGKPFEVPPRRGRCGAYPAGSRIKGAADSFLSDHDQEANRRDKALNSKSRPRQGARAPGRPQPLRPPELFLLRACCVAPEDRTIDPANRSGLQSARGISARRPLPDDTTCWL